MEGIVGIIISIILTGLIVPTIGITKNRLNKDIDSYYSQTIEIDKIVKVINDIDTDNIIEGLKEKEEIEIFVADEEEQQEQVLPLILYKDKIFNIIIEKEYIKVNELIRTYDLDKTDQGNYQKKDYTEIDKTGKYQEYVGIKNTRYIRR